MKVLITGDTGFIGKNMRNYLEQLGVEVLGYSRRRGQDLMDIKQFESFIKQEDPIDFIYHFAAEAKPGESVFKPIETIETNIKTTLNVLEVCRKYDIPVIYLSTCEVYGDSKIPITEEFPLSPPNPYAASKAAADRICYAYYRSYGLDVKIVRIFNPYGPYMQLNKIIPTVYRQAINNEPITIYGDGTDTRDYTYIEDIVRGLWLAKNLPPGEVINLATGKATTSLKIAKIIKELTKSTSKIIFVDYPKKFGGIKHQVGSYEKAKKLLGWEPKIDLIEGIKRTIAWLKGVYKNDC
ncbi:MAG: NAD-dependent epimerase/dehydratase family protein [Actinobacteria bacterium]|nr:NAD-dependent epimerase/dehydratase family protein [Actinomycetota bacterium]